MTIITIGTIGGVSREVTDRFQVRLVDKGHPTLEAIQILHPESRESIYLRSREMVLALMNQLEILVTQMEEKK